MIGKDAPGRDTERDGLFAGDDPFALAERWLAEAWESEINDANAIALSTVDAEGMPNVRIILLKEIEDEAGSPRPGGGFLFYTNRESAKGGELAANEKAALVLYWKSLGRQIRVRGPVEWVEDAKSDAYFATRHPQSRAGAVASQQSRPLESRDALIAATDAVRKQHEDDTPRPDNWGGYRVRPVEIEFWANGDHRLHDRFRWTRATPESKDWTVTRLNP